MRHATWRHSTRDTREHNATDDVASVMIRRASPGVRSSSSAPGSTGLQVGALKGFSRAQPDFCALGPMPTLAALLALRQSPPPATKLREDDARGSPHRCDTPARPLLRTANRTPRPRARPANPRGPAYRGSL